MLRKGAVLACVASAAAFAPAQLPLASRQKYAAAPAMALQNPVAQLSKVRALAKGFCVICGAKWADS